MAFKTAFVFCLVLVPCALAATKRFKRQFPGLGGLSGGFDFQGTLDKINQLSQQAQDLANTQIGSIPNSPNMPDMNQFLQNMPSLDFASGYTQEEIQRLGTLATTNQDFQQEVAELQKGNPGSADYKQLIDKYLNPNPNAGNVATNTSQNNPNMLNPSMGGQAFSNFDSDEYKQKQAELINRYNSGAGLVASLVALVASLVVQGLMMFG